MVTIVRLAARSINDSRGIPTVEATVDLSDGTRASAAVPAGTSTGRYEAVELRDNDPGAAGGKGVTKAVQNIIGELQVVLKGRPADLPRIDEAMIELDGTPNKRRLGANAILAISFALARACALSYRQPLYVFLANVYGRTLPTELPRPLVNMIEGGRHATTPLSVQEFHLIPEAATTAEQVADARRAFQTLGTVLAEQQFRVNAGLEGTYTAPFSGHEQVFKLLHEALDRANVMAGFGIDAAASEFFERPSGTYHLLPEETHVSAEQLCRLYESWTRSFPLQLIEDPCDQDDWPGWQIASDLLGGSVRIIGDDFLTTNLARIRRAFDRALRIGVLLKPNQIGTVTETVRACELAANAHAPTVMSNRSGETLDAFIADFAVALGVTYLKAGGPFAPERAVKYDRLVTIAEELHA